MDCYNCKQPYNDNDRSPRLLINCGHSICEKCTAELYRKNCIVCPECNFVNSVPSITCFPRNLALINYKKNSNTIGTSSPENLSKDQSSECPKHNHQY